MRNCKSCGTSCLSIYCNSTCHKEYIDKTKWITTKCETCEKDIKSRISRVKRFCSTKCASQSKSVIEKRNISIRNTCLERYGVPSVMESDFGKSQLKKSILERYGIDHYSKTDKFKTDFRNTCLEKYGVSAPMMNQYVKNKSKQTFINKYGGFTFQSAKLKSKVVNTMIDRYGVDNALKSDILKDKVRNTNLGRYGHETPLKNEDIIKKTKETLKNKWGIEDNISQNKEISDKMKDTNKEMYIDELFNGDRLHNKVIPLFSPEDYIDNGYHTLYKFKCITCNGEFQDNLYSGNIPKCPTCYPIIYTKISKFQRKVYEHILKSYPDALLEHYLPKINKYADILIPSINKIIECHGDYWHCNPDKYKSDYYHIRIHKTAQEIWTKDAERIKLLQDSGYTVEIVWEREVDNYINNIKY